jgi:lysozyme family protein
MDFDTAFTRLIGEEGGYVNDPQDPGGETNFGISKRAYPTEDIKNMTLARAKLIYKVDYWDKVRADELPAEIRFDLFDVAVNGGITRAIKLLQGAVNETQDGVLGPKTLAAAIAMEPFRLVARYNGWRLDYLNDLPTWLRFGKGWAQRVADILKGA